MTNAQSERDISPGVFNDTAAVDFMSKNAKFMDIKGNKEQGTNKGRNISRENDHQSTADRLTERASDNGGIRTAIGRQEGGDLNVRIRRQDERTERRLIF